MNTNTIREAVHQNIRVWCRRMGVTGDADRAVDISCRLFPGSVLRGPLTLVFSKFLANRGVDDKQLRLATAVTAAEAVARLIRAEVDLPLRPEAARASEYTGMSSAMFAQQEEDIIQLMSKALCARDREKRAQCGERQGVGVTLAKTIIRKTEW